MKKLTIPDRIILDILIRYGPQRFNSLWRMTKLSPPTQVKHLRLLEQMGYVEREGKYFKLKIDTPEWKTVWCLSNYSLLFPLDIDEGWRLVEKSSEALLTISSLGLNLEGKYKSGCPFHPPSLVCFRELEKVMRSSFPPTREEPKWVMTEVRLLLALGCFNSELKILEQLDSDSRSLEVSLGMEGLDPKKTLSFLRRERDNWEVFPAVGIARKLKVVGDIKRLLEWISPVVKDEGLPFFVFKSAEQGHLENILVPLWKRMGK